MGFLYLLLPILLLCLFRGLGIGIRHLARITFRHVSRSIFHGTIGLLCRFF